MGAVGDGVAVERSGDLFRISGPTVEVELSVLGGRLTSVRSADRGGRLDDVCLGLPNIEAYERDGAYHGALVGRVANRIGNSRFEIDRISHHLEANEGQHHLHGGPSGFHQVRWEAEPLPEEGGVRFRHHSPDQAGGYPGNLDVEATYRLSEDGHLSLTLEARADRATPVSLTHHPYWSLSGAGTIHDHILQVHAQSITPVTPQMIPTGKRMAIEGTPMDLQSPALLGPVIEATGGLDHNYVLNGPLGTVRPAAVLVHPSSGRRLSLSTSLPGLQVYTGGGLQGELGHGGRRHIPFSGVCLEPQYFPDAVNHPQFDSPILRPGEIWSHQIIVSLDVVPDSS